MFFLPVNLFFLFFLIMGTVITVSSTSWFTAWIGLKVNLMSFIPLISIKTQKPLSEAAIKYFLIQALGSSIIIMSSCIYLNFQEISMLFMMMAIILKMGAAPFHMWFPQVMQGLKWPQVIILMTIQKLAPMYLISYLMKSKLMILIILISSMMSAIFGSLGGINQVLLQKIMAYSSINHMAWMLSAMLISEKSWLMYFFFYSLISSSVALIFHFNKMNHLSNITNYMTSSNFISFTIPLSLLSLGGLPPFSSIHSWMNSNSSLFLNSYMYSFIHFTIINPNYIMFLYTNFYYYIYSKPNMKWFMSSIEKENFISSSMLFFNMIMLIMPSLFMIY
uniref:NADH-ubiquinone oxidoreductase chain 2 n=1 Tax=Homola orientalis TaxID=1550542 RepID=A0A191B601_9EUCA|nr:NADH dehydrogenase subunit 2 [Homola orientalis]